MLSQLCRTQEHLKVEAKFRLFLPNLEGTLSLSTYSGRTNSGRKSIFTGDRGESRVSERLSFEGVVGCVPRKKR